jgi:hypothetical protein
VSIVVAGSMFQPWVYQAMRQTAGVAPPLEPSTPFVGQGRILPPGHPASSRNAADPLPSNQLAASAEAVFDVVSA